MKLLRNCTDSQNCCGWKGLLEVTWSNRLLKHLELLTQDHVQAAFEDLQGGIPNNLSGQPVPVLHHPHSTEVIPDVQREPLVFQSVTIASCPGNGHH